VPGSKSTTSGCSNKVYYSDLKLAKAVYGVVKTVSVQNRRVDNVAINVDFPLPGKPNTGTVEIYCIYPSIYAYYGETSRW
jgi:hypothetical protein